MRCEDYPWCSHGPRYGDSGGCPDESDCDRDKCVERMARWRNISVAGIPLSFIVGLATGITVAHSVLG